MSCVSIMKSEPEEGYQPPQESENNSMHELLICIWEHRRLHNRLYKPGFVLYSRHIGIAFYCDSCLHTDICRIYTFAPKITVILSNSELNSKV